MRVHQFSEPGMGFLVTGTDDIEAAARAVLDEYRAELEDEMGTYGDDPYVLKPGDPMKWFEKHPGVVEVGRIVPANRAEREDGIHWWWRAGYKLGKQGVTTAVVFPA